MKNVTNTASKVRVELHESPKTAKRSERRWQQMGFSTKIYFVNETSEDTITALEVWV